jgi:hypothetical protein
LDGLEGRASPPLLIPDYLQGRALRSSGLHHSDLLHYIMRKMNWESSDADFSGWEYAALIGFAFEDTAVEQLETMALASVQAGMERQLRNHDWGVTLLRGLEFWEEGIFLSPDGIDAQTGELWEFKFTWRGLKKSPPEARFDWMMQLKSYCRAVGTRSAVLCSLYACGDYSPPKPRMLFTRFTFTEREIEENWRTVLGAVGPYQAEQVRIAGEKRGDGL